MGRQQEVWRSPRRAQHPVSPVQQDWANEGGINGSDGGDEDWQHLGGVGALLSALIVAAVIICGRSRLQGARAYLRLGPKCSG